MLLGAIHNVLPSLHRPPSFSWLRRPLHKGHISRLMSLSRRPRTLILCFDGTANEYSEQVCPHTCLDKLVTLTDDRCLEYKRRQTLLFV